MRFLVFSCIKYIHIASSGLETRCSSRRKFLAVGEDTLVLNVPLEVLDQLLDCLDDVLTSGIPANFPKVIVLFLSSSESL